jgi:hypothetical protein
MPPRTINTKRVNKQYSTVHDDCLTFEYIANKRTGFPNVSAQAQYPTHNETISYFEVLIIKIAKSSSIAIGLGPNTLSSSKLPGSEKNTFAIVSDGRKYTSNEFYNYNGNEPFCDGDVIGCGFNRETMEIFFTKNGVFLGVAFRNIPLTTTFFPTFGLSRPGDKIKVNFGETDFMFDYQEMHLHEYNIINYRFESTSPQLEILNSGRTIRYIQRSGPAGSAQTNHPFPRNVKIGYYEVKIDSAGKDGLIGVGLCKC